MEKTLVLIKPDGVEKGLERKIIKRYEDAGLKMVKRKEITPTPQLLKRHYSAHVAKPFYPDLEKFMSSGTVVVMIFEGTNAVAIARKVTGATDPAKAEKGTIRRDLGDLSLPDDDRIMMNLVHASATKEEAEREIKLWFGKI
jgi:nucleoside-diphosphate kinase